MTTPNQYDTPWKEALERYLPAFFAFFFPAIAAEIDWARGHIFLDSELQKAVQLGLWGCTLAFTFPVVKLLDYAAQETALLADHNPFATVVLAHLAAQATRRQPALRQTTKFALTRRLYELGYARQEILDLFRFIDWLLQLPQELEDAFWAAITTYEEAQQMTYITTVERRGIERGRAEGLAEGEAKGLAEGEAKGLAEGEAKGLRAGIALALELKFGAAGLALVPQLAAIRDLAQLAALAEQLRTAPTVEALTAFGEG